MTQIKVTKCPISGLFKGDRIRMTQIKVTACPIPGLFIIEPAVHGDARGYFMETYNRREMAEFGLNGFFVQDNQSLSAKGVLRGLHFQKQHPQEKLVRVRLWARTGTP